MTQDQLHSAAELQAELERLNQHLDDALSVFAKFEATINQALKTAGTQEERNAILDRRTAYERTLGIDSIIERIDALSEHLRSRQRAS